MFKDYWMNSSGDIISLWRTPHLILKTLVLIFSPFASDTVVNASDEVYTALTIVCILFDDPALTNVLSRNL